MLFISNLSSKENGTHPTYIMHASGSFGEEVYLNSQDSMDYYISQGETIFEIDFIYTKDGKLVCSHEFENLADYSLDNPPTYEQYLNTLVCGKYQPLTLAYLVKTLKDNPQIVIIFDTKQDVKIQVFNELYTILKSYDVDTKSQLIAQTYSYLDFLLLKDYDIKELWFTNYHAKYSQATINQYFGDEETIATIVLSYEFYNSYLQQGLIINKPIAIHSSKLALTKQNTVNLDVKYVFIEY